MLFGHLWTRSHAGPEPRCWSGIGPLTEPFLIFQTPTGRVAPQLILGSGRLDLMRQPVNSTSSIQVQTRFKSLEDLTVEALREAILDSRYEPGEHLRERELAESFGVSTTPVKEALRRLEVEGLVHRIPSRGAFVTNSLATFIAEIGLLRSSLEGTAAYLAASKATDADIVQLRNQIALMEQHTTTGEVAAAAEANEEFHALIHAVANNHFLWQMSMMVRSYDHATRLQALSGENEPARALLEHKAIYYAIADKNPQQAESKMREHVLRTTKYLDEQKNQREDKSNDH